ncbi:MAG: acyltransferase domain-containing protein, partial [Pseudomonadota bacterium]
MTLTAFIFPGQGSQSVGMLSELAATQAAIQSTFEQASDALGRDCWSLVTEGPVEELNKTEWTQPMMLAADIALWRTVEHLDALRPSLMAG